MSKMKVAKVTLSTGKVVYLRDIEISDTEKAAEMVAQRAGDNQNLLQLFMQKALVQILLVKIDTKMVTGIDREEINKHFTMAEYTQLLKVIGKMSGGDELGKDPKLELVAEPEA